MIIFAPEYDDETRPCAQLARRLSGVIHSHPLIADAALRTNLVSALAANTHGECALFGHGWHGGVAGQHGQQALAKSDFRYLPQHAVFGYCCFSAIFGQHAAERGWSWWGYDNRMQPPPFESVRHEDIVGLYRYLLHRFARCLTETEVRNLISEFKEIVTRTVEEYEKRQKLSASGAVFFRQLWTRLRVWLPGAIEAIGDTEAFGGELDWSAPS